MRAVREEKPWLKAIAVESAANVANLTDFMRPPFRVLGLLDSEDVTTRLGERSLSKGALFAVFGDRRRKLTPHPLVVFKRTAF